MLACMHTEQHHSCVQGSDCCSCPLQVRAKQHYSQDEQRMKNMGILLHGDGAFSGQVGCWAGNYRIP